MLLQAPASTPLPGARPELVAQARAQLMAGAPGALLGTAPAGIAAWLWRSWWRCLGAGRASSERVEFNAVSREAQRRAQDQHADLLRAARAVMAQLTSAVAGLGYFCLLTDDQGVVLEVQGALDHADRRALAVGRIGVDLSEPGVGTSAIGAALIERAPVWLHRSEHFFDDLAPYSCAGAPVFGPRGQCLGMLDITGIDVRERPELMHLAQRCARAIEDRLLRAQPHAVLLHLNWPGGPLGQEGEGLLALDGDGQVLGSNAMARQLAPQPLRAPNQPLHCGELIAMPWDAVIERARQRPNEPLPIPLWSGLRLHALAQHGPLLRPAPVAMASVPAASPLKLSEQVLIQQALLDSGGNIGVAAKALGMSRATLYRRLGKGKAARG